MTTKFETDLILLLRQQYKISIIYLTRLASRLIAVSTPAIWENKRRCMIDNNYNPNDNAARQEIVRILQACNVSSEDRIVLKVDNSTDQPLIEIQKLSFPLGRFFKSFATWTTARTYRDSTYERLLQQVKAHPEWLAFEEVFTMERQYVNV